MQLNRIERSIQNDAWPASDAGHDPSALTSIYEDNANIAIWKRSPQKMLDLYAAEWADRYPSHTPRLLLSVDNVTDQLEKLLPELKHKNEFQQDVALLVGMFSCLFDADEVGLRLTPLTKAMCPKFHVDNIPCRLVTTYGGLGTEWLLEEHIDRNRLGRGSNGLPDHESGLLQGDKVIQQLPPQYVALLKGSGWLGNEEHGLVHRSPSLSSGQTRLLLTLDFA